MLAWNYDIHVANNPITAIINLNKMQEILPNEKNLPVMWDLVCL